LNRKTDYFYGPVPSRRLGFSLGVDITPGRVCTFNCLYCQLGDKSKKTIARRFYVNLKEFKKQLKDIIKQNPRIDYITFSGSGEPTLHKDLDKIINTVKKITQEQYPVCVITNSSLLYRKKVRQELQSADLVIPSLDSVTESIFKKINQPQKSICLAKIIKGLELFRKEFKKDIWLEVMLLKGINDTDRQIGKLKKIIDKINPDKVQLNLPVRPSSFTCGIPETERIKKIKSLIGSKAEVVNSFASSRLQKKQANTRCRILRLLKIRPVTLNDLSFSLGLNPADVSKHLTVLIQQEKIRVNKRRKKLFFTLKQNYDQQ
jgi:wyosine [tRNA(Phe)-imidazoG37] synthetase (radical SAM superfamily)